MTTSSVPAVKAALVAVLSAALPTVQVSWSDPGDVIENTSIAVGSASGTGAISTLRAGRKHRDESYSVEVIFSVLMPGDDPHEAEAEAFRLMAFLEDILANNPRALGTISAQLAAFEAESGRTDGGAACNLTAQVRSPTA